MKMSLVLLRAVFESRKNRFLMPRCLVNNPAGLYFLCVTCSYSYLHRIVLSQRALIMVIVGTVCCSLTSAGKEGSVERTEALK